MAWKDVFTQRALRMLGGVRVANLRQQLPRRCGQGRFMRRILFDARRRFRPDALAEVEVTIEYGTMEEKRAALIERGFDPDVLDQAAKPKFLLELQKEAAE